MNVTGNLSDCDLKSSALSEVPKACVVLIFGTQSCMARSARLLCVDVNMWYVGDVATLEMAIV